MVKVISYVILTCVYWLQAMAVAGMGPDGRHRSIDHPKVLRTPPDSPHRVRASYHTRKSSTPIICVSKSHPLNYIYKTKQYQVSLLMLC